MGIIAGKLHPSAIGRGTEQAQPTPCHATTTTYGTYLPTYVKGKTNDASAQPK
ncbi:hypothetical protein X777_16346 [Ooceraea biroi]|uniref:Uncharacterized protein n=1 Tax=Ooceraea biroi TaxID=2015173 RepID=A0A026VU92_OOCBI|nr:hypothetical protein X777_16346 [Ooceraea biroi]